MYGPTDDSGETVRVVADERRPFDAFDVVDLDALADPHVAADLHPGDVQPHLLVERVGVRLPVLVEVADVLPVALADVAVDRAPHLEQQREELLREVEGAVLGDVPQHLGLEHVDAGVDRVGEHLAPRRLLEEALDLPVLVGDDDPELERVLDRLEADRDRGALLLVQVDDLVQVDVAERVARDDEERLVEPVRREPHRAGGAERALLDRVLDVQAEVAAVAEVGADRLRQERHRDHDVAEAVVAQQLEDVLHARLADDRHHRLRLVRGQRAKARPLPAGHHDGSHASASRRAFSAYSPSAMSPSTSPLQKIQSGHSVPFGVTIMNAEGGVEQPGCHLADQVDLELVAAAEHDRRPDERHRSRAGMISASHGSRPACSSRITAASIISRSASGSANFPNADSTCQRRAR